jgi:N utilization substance protein B
VSEAPARPHRTARRKARKYALDLLFAADLRGLGPAAVLAEESFTTEEPPPAYSRALVAGVAERQAEIDGLITGRLARGWSLDRMPRVDRCLARIAVYELAWTDTPADVAIAEAAALAAELSTEASASFLSGLLGGIAKDRSAAEGPVKPQPAGSDLEGDLGGGVARLW